MKLEFGTGSRFGQLNFANATEIIDYALKLGINRFDTGYTYGNFKSQPLLGRCLKKLIINSRESIYLSTKGPAESEDYIEYCIKKSIETLDCKYIDNFYLWGPSMNQLENKSILKKLKSLKQIGLINKISVNTHELSIIKKISTGYFEEIDGIMVDYNLLQQDRKKYLIKIKKNNLTVFAGTVLCQGQLIESIYKTYFRTFSPFYLGRSLLRKNSRKYFYPAQKLRKHIKTNYKNLYQKIPLSFVCNEEFVDYIPMGMLSFSSLKKNTEIINNPIDKKITNKISQWAKKNCQIKDSIS